MIIKKPVVTEKSIKLYKEQNKVTFEVAHDANTVEAKKEVESIFGVKVIDNWTHSRLGKVKTNRKNNRKSRTGNKKLMIFELKKGDKIEIFNQ